MARTTTGKDPAILRRRLTRELRRLRGDTTQREVAEAMDWSPSKLLRIENGMIGISTSDLRALLAHYEVDDAELIDDLVGLAQQSKRPAASAFADVLDPEMIVYLRYESSASRIRQYHPYLVPGLLQTEEYARALITAFAPAGTPIDLIDRQVEARLQRQEIFTGETLISAQFLLDEVALLRRADRNRVDTGLMRRQLQHLLELDRDERIAIQVLPLAGGVRRDAQWPFLLLDFPDEHDDTLVYLEGRETSVSRDDPEAVVRYASAFIELETAACTGADMVDLVNRHVG